MVEHLICNQGVGGSNPSSGTITFGTYPARGEKLLQRDPEGFIRNF
jgi:hypothetical protein